MDQYNSSGLAPGYLALPHEASTRLYSAPPYPSTKLSAAISRQNRPNQLGCMVKIPSRPARIEPPDPRVGRVMITAFRGSRN